MRRTAIGLLVLALGLAGCGDDEPSSDGAPATTSAPVASGDDGTPTGTEADTTRPDAPTGIPVGATWAWQLQGEVDTSLDVDVYDVDLFDPPDATFDAIRDGGSTLVCYFSAGSWEEWRDDADAFPAAALGLPLDGWEGELWLDHRVPAVRDALAARLDLAAARGCHGVEPDNVQSHLTDTGFDLTEQDQLDLNRWLAAEARARGLLVGLKNDLEHLDVLVDDFDFAVNEECFQYDECAGYAVFVAAGKAVLSAEYDPTFVDDPAPLCARAAELGMSTLVLPLELDGSFRVACDD